MQTRLEALKATSKNSEELFGDSDAILVLSTNDSQLNDEIFESIPADRWNRIWHNTGGGTGNTAVMTCAKLKICKPVVFRINELVKAYKNSGLARQTILLNDVIQYRADLQETLNLDCNETYVHLEEGIYPIDCDIRTLKLITDDCIPEELVNKFYFTLFILSR